MLLNDTCHDMDDEEHAKLSVRLMNCQSEAEGRPTFKCTQEMVYTHTMSCDTFLNSSNFMRSIFKIHLIIHVYIR